MSDNGERALTHLRQQIWDAYAGFYDAYRVDSGAVSFLIRRWDEISESHKALFASEIDSDHQNIMKVVRTIGSDDAFD